VQKNYNEQFTAWISKGVNNLARRLLACTPRAIFAVSFRCVPNSRINRNPGQVIDPAGASARRHEDTEQERTRGRWDKAYRRA